jgi:hypothetical protein
MKKTNFFAAIKNAASSNSESSRQQGIKRRLESSIQERQRLARAQASNQSAEGSFIQKKADLVSRRIGLLQSQIDQTK